jgi:hypothetical protein
MDREEALRLLRTDVREWNKRKASGEPIPDLSGAKLRGVDLTGADLSGAVLRGVNLSEADLYCAVLSGAVLSGADLSRAFLFAARLGGSFLNTSDLNGANLFAADLGNAHLGGAKVDRCLCYATRFTNVDLSQTEGLESIEHHGPSTVGIDTIIKSAGKIPEAFLRGCGVPDVWIANIPALLGAMQPIQFYSCFISYSHKDGDFARRLHGRMVQAGLRVWYAPEDIQGGKMIHDQLDHAIQVHDRLLLVLSVNSMGSQWVETEIVRALEAGRREGRQKLFPIRLVDMEAVQAWRCPDPDTGADLAREIRKFHIPDFSGWKDHDPFEAAFAKLLRDLKDDDPRAGVE